MFRIFCTINPLEVKTTHTGKNNRVLGYTLMYLDRYKEKEVYVDAENCVECLNLRGTMILAIIKPKSPDINGVVYGMLAYARIHPVARETGSTVTLKVFDYLIEFNKKYILRKW